jgi:hypothetical protein
MERPLLARTMYRATSIGQNWMKLGKLELSDFMNDQKYPLVAQMILVLLGVRKWPFSEASKLVHNLALYTTTHAAKNNPNFAQHCEF